MSYCVIVIMLIYFKRFTRCILYVYIAVIVSCNSIKNDLVCF